MGYKFVKQLLEFKDHRAQSENSTKAVYSESE